MQIVFSSPVYGLTLDDLSLTCDGGDNLLTTDQTLTTADNITYTLGNLSSLQADDGYYLLTLSAANGDISNEDGFALATDVTSGFTLDTTPPTVAVGSDLPGATNMSVSEAEIDFSEPITGISLGSFSLTRDGGANLLTSSQSLESWGNGMTYTLTGLDDLTDVEGVYVLTFTAAGSGTADLAGNAIAADASATFVVNATAPTATITAISPNTRSSALSEMQIVFSEPVYGLTLSALSLTKDGGANLLTSSQILTTTDNITYTLGNLSSITNANGTYTLALTASGSEVADAADNALAGDASASSRSA